MHRLRRMRPGVSGFSDFRARRSAGEVGGLRAEERGLFWTLAQRVQRLDPIDFIKPAQAQYLRLGAHVPSSGGIVLRKQLEMMNPDPVLVRYAILTAC